MVSISQMQCACEECLCVISTSDAVQQGGRFYCSDACARHEAIHHSCGHPGCPC